MLTMQENSRSRPLFAAGPGARKSFLMQFKADVVALVLDEGWPIASVARSLGTGESESGQLGATGPHRPRRARGAHHR